MKGKKGVEELDRKGLQMDSALEEDDWAMALYNEKYVKEQRCLFYYQHKGDEGGWIKNLDKKMWKKIWFVGRRRIWHVSFEIT